MHLSGMLLDVWLRLSRTAGGNAEGNREVRVG
jgi:hypothetical protein